MVKFTYNGNILGFLKSDRFLLLNNNSIAEISKVEKGEKKNFFENLYQQSWDLAISFC